MTTSATVIPLPRAARRRRREELEFLPAALEIIETPASPAGRAIAGTVMAFLVVAILWATCSQVDIIATTEGRIIPSGKSKTIQPFETGVVRSIRVNDGSSVRVGDVLVELDPTADAADESRLSYDLAQDRLDVARLVSLIDGDLSRFEAAAAGADPHLVATARYRMQAQAAGQAAKAGGIERQIAGKEAEVREAQATIEKLQMALPLISEQRDIRKALLAKEFGSRISYLQIEQQVVETEHGIAAQQQHITTTREALAASERQLTEAHEGYRRDLLADLAKAETAVSEHGQEVAKAAQKRGLRLLTAPVEGTVQQLAVHTVGGIVTPAQQLMVLVPKDSSLEIETTLPNKDVAFVHAGQEAEIKIEAFTFTRYGLIHGTVTSVSQDAVSRADGGGDDRGLVNPSLKATRDDERQAHQPGYVAHIALQENGIQTEEGYRPLEPGMSVTAEVKTGRRTVTSYLLSPLLRYRHEALKER